MQVAISKSRKDELVKMRKTYIHIVTHTHILILVSKSSSLLGEQNGGLTV